MARVCIIRVWPDGDVLEVRVLSGGYPDALAEAKRIALDTYREALGVTLADVPDEDA